MVLYCSTWLRLFLNKVAIYIDKFQRKVAIYLISAQSILRYGYLWETSGSLLIKIYHDCEGGIEKSIPRITDWHQEACRVMTNGDREGRIFLSHSQTNNEFFFLLTTKYLILNCKNMKKTSRESWICWDALWWCHYNYNDVMDRRAASVRLFVFVFSPRAGTGLWERIILHG